MPKVSANPLTEIENDQPDLTDLCCDDNTYRASLVDSVCTDCPTGSTSKLGGYYCEANPSTKEKEKKKEKGKEGKKKEEKQKE